MPQHFYRRNLPHMQKDARPHFLTFCTHRRAILHAWARSLTLECCVHEHDVSIDLHAAVVMPDHVHLIFTPLIDQERSEVVALAQITKSIKSASAHMINRRLGRHGPVWQIESFDRVLRSSEQLDAKIAYLRANPVRRGLVSLPEEWPWLWMPTEPRIFFPQPAHNKTV
jgi:REP element-mobilizing transposase RayT